MAPSCCNRACLETLLSVPFILVYLVLSLAATSPKYSILIHVCMCITSEPRSYSTPHTKLYQMYTRFWVGVGAYTPLTSGMLTIGNTNATLVHASDLLLMLSRPRILVVQTTLSCGYVLNPHTSSDTWRMEY